MNWHVCTVIGYRVETEKLEQQIRPQSTAVEAVVQQAKLKLVDAKAGFSYVCSYVHGFEIFENKLLNYEPRVLRQDKNWDKDKVRRFLEQFHLWNDDAFGIWTFAVRPENYEP